MVTICTICFYIRNCAFYPHSVFMCSVCSLTNTVWLVILSWRSQWRFPSSDVMARSVEQIYWRFGKRAASVCTLSMVTTRHSETSLNFCQSVVFHSPAVSGVCRPYRGSSVGQSPVSHGGICGEQSGTRTGLCVGVSAFPWQYLSTIAPYSSSHLPPTLCKLSNGQRR